ncbi:hypothetical protein EVAR_32086_1 [Eumeta japonica]|uniref:Uncharacterized protein n=1 Tax=Eumeta variegata TaxID=151549 RepID=A0A4C1V459_EUMVA|nr:hypothetical protein EVAR_32086_1 [Eumeta japonica]
MLIIRFRSHYYKEMHNRCKNTNEAASGCERTPTWASKTWDEIPLAIRTATEVKSQLQNLSDVTTLIFSRVLLWVGADVSGNKSTTKQINHLKISKRASESSERGHAQPQRSYRCVGGLLGGKRIHNREVISLIEGRHEGKGYLRNDRKDFDEDFWNEVPYGGLGGDRDFAARPN